MEALAWWAFLYYPILFGLLFLSRRTEKRFPAESIERKRRDQSLGCILVSLWFGPLFIGIGQIIWHLIIKN